MTDLRLRDAEAGDLELLTQLLSDALAWRKGEPVARDEVLSHPRLARFLEGWPLPDDAGVVGELDRAVGAAWYRRVAAVDEGFVSDSIPVVTVAVRADQRGRGHGTALLQALTAKARREGVSALSLGLAADHPAVGTYLRLGFRHVGAHDGNVTLLLELS